MGLVVLMVLSFNRWEGLSSYYVSLPTWMLLFASASYLLVPGAFLLFGQGQWVQARRFAGVAATTLGAMASLPAVILPLVLLLVLGAGFGGGAPQVQPILGTVYNSLDGGRRLSLERPVAATAAPAPTQPALVPPQWEGGAAAAAQLPPRLRQYFPETLYWSPEVLTDQSGRVYLTVPMADSITTWRLTALASSQDGRLGFTTRGVRVFQDFFVDIDLPVALTEGDEIGIPVAVYNYLAESQEVRLVVQDEPWFKLLGPRERVLTIAANDVDVVYFPIHVSAFGRQGFQVTAWGQQMSDAIRRQVTVLPNGKAYDLSQSDWLRASGEVTLTMPAEAISGTAQVEVKIYPGAMAQVVEGLEKILRRPYG